MMRKQYYISQYNVRDLRFRKKENHLIFKEENKVSYSISENLLFKKLYEITGKEFKDGEIIDDIFVKAKPKDNPLEDLFILKANSIKPDSEKQLAIYDRLVKEGCYINDIHYLYAEKSSSQIRQQRTVFIKEDVIKNLQEHLTLGKQPKKCVTSKWLTTKGYLLSSVDVLNLMPRIIVIPDFIREIIDDVYIMEDFEPTEEQKQEYIKFTEEKELADEEYKKYKKETEKAKKKFTMHYLNKKFDCIEISDKLKSKSQWREKGRRVKTEEVLNPSGWNYNKYNKNVWVTYTEEQTEVIKEFPATPLTCSKSKVFHKDYTCSLNCFDGMGIMSMDFAEKVRKELNVPYNVNSIQLRLPYVKSNVVRVDWKNWMLGKGIRTITPMSFDGEPVETVDIMDIDIIMTESCFKAKLEKTEGKSGWLFKNMQEYYDLLAKYGWTYCGVTNYSHPHFDNEYNTLTYQFINSTELTYKDLGKVGKEEYEMLKKVRQGDTASVKNFLNIVVNKKAIDLPEDDEDEEENIKEEKDYKDKAKVFMQCIEDNERFVFDSEVQKFILQRVKNYFEDMQIGRILIPSQFLVATGDIIAFLEWMVYRKEEKVKGFLNAEEFYCEGKDEKYVMTRYPLTHYSQFKVADFVNKSKDNNYKWVKHLNNIIQFNTYDLTMPRLTEDVDGDKNLIIKADTPIYDNRVLKDAIVEDFIIFNPDDKKTTDANEYNTEAILKFEHLNMNNATGRITNLNSTYQTLALKEGSPVKKDYESSMCMYLQGEIIDSVKKGNKVEIPQALMDNAKLKPYFMKHIYGDDSKKYLPPLSPLDKFCVMVEKKIAKLYPDDVSNEKYEIPEDAENKEDIFTSYLDCGEVYRLMQCPSTDSKKELELLSKLIPIFNDYSTKRGDIVQDGKGLNRLSRLDNDKEKQKLLRDRYKALYQDTKEKAEQACKEVYGELKPSILASIAVDIEYVYAKDKNELEIHRNKSHNFPWIICPEGILQNVKLHKGAEKTKVYRISEKDAEELINKNMKVYKVMEKTLAVKTINVPIEEKKEVPAITNVIPIKDYKCNIMFCSGEEANNILAANNNKAVLRLKDGKFYTFFAGTDMVGSVAKQCVDYVGENMSFTLKDYIGKEFYIKVTKVNNASLITEISYVA